MLLKARVPTDSGAARADRAIQGLCAASLTGPFRSTSKPQPLLRGSISPMRILVLPQRVQVHTFFCSSLSQLPVPLVPANKANKSRLHGADLSWIGRYSGGRPGVNGMRRQAT